MQKFRANQYFYTQKLISRTEMFGKVYFWMEDVDGTLYAVPADKDGNPDLTRG